MRQKGGKNMSRKRVSLEDRLSEQMGDLPRDRHHFQFNGVEVNSCREYFVAQPMGALPPLMPIKEPMYLPPAVQPIPTYCNPDALSFETKRDFGLIDPKPFVLGYDLPSGNQVHFHGDNVDSLQYGHVKTRNNEYIGDISNGYDSAIAAGNMDNLGFNKYTPKPIEPLYPINSPQFEINSAIQKVQRGY
jgi:hypothetical protein